MTDPVAPPEQDRRASARLPVEMWVEEITDRSQVFRRAGNLSKGGMYLDHTIPLPMGARVRLRFTLPGDDKSVTVAGEIVSVSTDQELGMGVKFVDMTPEVASRIDAYIERVLSSDD